MTPLHYAAWQGSIDCVQLLLEHKADINKPDAVSGPPVLTDNAHTSVHLLVGLGAQREGGTHPHESESSNALLVFSHHLEPGHIVDNRSSAAQHVDVV